jgi:hypothetical protein
VSTTFVEDRVMFGATALVLTASLLAGGVPAEKAFKEYGDFVAGGVWTSTDAQGNKLENRWQWILDKSFLQLTQMSSDESFQEIHGIDPATGQWAYWGFTTKGRLWKGVAENTKAGEWMFRDSGQGKTGSNSWKGKEVKLGADQTRLEIQENIVEGKRLPPEVQIWTRKK